MALHSEPDDVPAIRAALRRAWDSDWMYSISSLVEALGRHPGLGPFDELRTVFTEVSYSYARRRAARAMVASDPEFVALFADECLWDCEAETRQVGVETSRLLSPAARSRVVSFSTSEFETAAVRTAAATRLEQTI